MIALDTNVLVRFLHERDDPRAHRRARALVSSRRVHVGVTVLLETHWVLCKSFGFSAAEAIDLLEGVLGIDTVSVAHTDAVVRAFAWTRAGIDFADAMHLALARDAEAFGTFDQDLVRRGTKLRTEPAVIAA